MTVTLDHTTTACWCWHVSDLIIRLSHSVQLFCTRCFRQYAVVWKKNGREERQTQHIACITLREPSYYEKEWSYNIYLNILQWNITVGQTILPSLLKYCSTLIFPTFFSLVSTWLVHFTPHCTCTSIVSLRCFPHDARVCSVTRFVFPCAQSVHVHMWQYV